jgi:hypothetical protein
MRLKGAREVSRSQGSLYPSWITFGQIKVSVCFFIIKFRLFLKAEYIFILIAFPEAFLRERSLSRYE